MALGLGLGLGVWACMRAHTTQGPQIQPAEVLARSPGGVWLWGWGWGWVCGRACVRIQPKGLNPTCCSRGQPVLCLQTERLALHVRALKCACAPASV